jgi:multiple sugar transport system permease protein
VRVGRGSAALTTLERFPLPPRRGTHAVARTASRLAWPVILVGPALLLLVVFVFYPIGSTFWMAVNDVNQFGQSRGFVGLDNFVSLLNDRVFWDAFRRTLVWTVVAVGASLGLGLFAATVLDGPFRGRTMARVLILLPWAASLPISVVVWAWVFNADWGIVNRLIADAGIADARIDWLARPELAFPVMVWIAIWVTTPFSAISLLAGLQSVDRSLLEAARIDGASGMAAFRFVAFPLLRPVFAVVVIYNVIAVFNSFVIVWVLTEGGPGGKTDILASYVYKIGFRFYEMGRASAIAVVMFLMLLVIAVIYTRFMRRGIHES